MYFDFDDRHPDYEGLRSGMGRGGVVVPWWVVWAWVSILLHVAFVLVAVFVPDLIPVRTQEEAARQAAILRQRDATSQQFVFVQPRAEFEAKRPPQTPDLSDRDRLKMTPLKPPDPQNDLPYSRGNTPERIDQPGTPAPPKPQPDAPPNQAESQPSRETGAPAPGQPGQAQADDPVLRGLTGPAPKPQAGDNGSGAGGTLSNALRDVTRYVPQQIFENAQGGGQFGSAIQFDTKGVEFGPWVRRFIAHIKRNWFIPYAAMSLKGHVVVTFNVHKDGSITDVTVVGPCPIDAFNNSSFNAIAASNPTQPLPPEYPSDKAFFTVTFFYNEQPPR
jgi:TonB family protein